MHVLDFDPSSLSLQSLCRKAEQVCVTCLSADEASQTLAVGDVLRSVSLYRLTVELLAGRQLAQLELLAGERVRRNVTAMTRLPEDPNRLLVCDAYGNLCILALAEDREIDRSNPQRRLAPREWLHLDDQVNRVVAGSLFRGGGQRRGRCGSRCGVSFGVLHGEWSRGTGGRGGGERVCSAAGAGGRDGCCGDGKGVSYRRSRRWGD